MKTIKGDILAIDKGIIVHGCNCMGVMGAGIALQIKNKYPVAYEAYIRRKEKSGLILGDISYAPVNEDMSKFIINANTQLFTGQGRQVSYDAIEDCFLKVINVQSNIYRHYNHYLPICFPKIGAGLGGGNWNIVQKIIEETIPYNIEARLYVLE